MTPARARGALFALIAVAFGTTAAGFQVYFLKDDLSLAMFTDAEGHFLPGAFFDQLLWPTARTWDDIWRPVPALTWGLDYCLFGANAAAFHIWNILGHVVNVLLLEALLRRLLAGPLAPRAAFLGALLFSLYPLAPEAILWTTQRTVVFGLGFSLAALSAWMDWLRGTRTRHLVLAFVYAALGLLSREHALAVFPMLGLLALQHGSPGTRFKAVRIAVIGSLVLVALYFACRWLIFGRFSGGYAGTPSMSAYAEANGTFEHLGRTLKLLFFPFSDAGPALGLGFLFTLLMGVSFAAALGTALLSRARGTGLPALALSSVSWLALSWAPVLFVFIIFPNLLNGRSAYHLMALPLGCLGACLAHLSLSPVKAGLMAAPALLLFAMLYTGSVANYVEAGASVRGLQQGIHAATTKNDLALVFNVPTEHSGAPTVDSYLPFLMRQPYLMDARNAEAFVLDRKAEWPALFAKSAATAAAMELQLRWLRALPKAPWVHDLTPTATPGEGAPVELLAPQEAVHLGRASAPPVLRARVSAAAASACVLLDVPGRSLRLAVPLALLGRDADGALTLPLQPLLASAGLGDWPLPTEVFAADDPLIVTWRIEVSDAGGAVLGTSASRHMVLTSF